MTTQNREQCLNCQSDLDGPYCSRCGQAKSARLIPLNQWLGNFLNVVIDLDSKLLRTLKRLLLQPGQATVDFADGRRVPFSGPVRTYIIVSAISIAAMTLRGTFAGDNSMLFPGMEVDAEFQERVQFWFPFVNLLSPFLTAGILAVFHRRQFFQLHLAFSLHLWTFFIAFTTPLIFIPATSIWALLAFAVLTVVLVGYVYVAYQPVYQSPFIERLFIVGAVLFSIPLATVVFGMVLLLLASIVP